MAPKITISSAMKHARQLRRAVRLVWDSAPGWTAAQMALVVVQGLLPLVILYLMRRIVDEVSKGLAAPSPHVFQQALVWVGMAFGAAILSAGARSLSEYAGQAQSLKVTDTVSDILHARSIAVDLEYYEDPSYYDTLHRAQQEAPYRPTRIINGLVQMAQNTISLIGIAGLLFSFNWILGLVLLLVSLPGVLVRLFYSRKLYNYEEKQTENERLAWYYHWLLVDSSFAKEIRLFNLGELFRGRFHALRTDIRHGRLDLTRRRSLADFLVQVLASAAIFSTVALAALQTIQGAITVGEMVVIYVGFQSGIGFMQSTLHALAGLYEDNIFLTNFYRFLDLKPAIQAPPHPHPFPDRIQQGICFQNVSFGYHTREKPALQDINLSLAPGEVIALVGENGSGKTTLIKLLCQLYQPTCGQITLDGVELRQYDPVRWRREIGVIFQDYAQYYLKAWENIWLGNIERNPDPHAIKETALLTGADAVIQRLPRQYQTRLGTWFTDGQELSTGEWQKIALARAFWRQARIIVLDEPTSSLDPLAEAELFRNFRQLLEGRSAILISHRFSTVSMADRIYVLDQGHMVESGSHRELLQRNGRYANLYHAQAGFFQNDSPKW